MRTAGLPVVPVVVALLLAGGCATGSGTQQQAEVQVGPPRVEVLRQAAATTRDAGTGRFEGRYSFTARNSEMFGGDAAIEASVEGAFDVANRREHDVLVLESYQADDDGGSGPTVGDRYEQIIDGDVLYERETVGGVVKQVDGRPWLRRQVSSGDVGSVLGGLLGSSGMLSPQQILDQLTSLDVSVEDLGPADVRGVSTQRLRAVVSARDLEERATVGTTSSMRPGEGPDAITSCVDDADTQVPLEVFVDTERRVRRIAIDYDLGELYATVERCFYDHPQVDFGETPGTRPSATAGRPTPTVRMTLTIDIVDLGQPVDIPIPDPSQVREPTGVDFTPVGTVVR